QTQACAVLVVGRRTPTGEIIRPASALNRLDLPLPVGPASATTVSSGATDSRCRAWSATARVARSRSGGRYGETARRNRPSASIRLPSAPASNQAVANPGGAENGSGGAARAGTVSPLAAPPTGGAETGWPETSELEAGGRSGSAAPGAAGSGARGRGSGEVAPGTGSPDASRHSTMGTRRSLSSVIVPPDL